jgi:hypothetical protein
MFNGWKSPLKSVAEAMGMASTQQDALDEEASRKNRPLSERLREIMADLEAGDELSQQRRDAARKVWELAKAEREAALSEAQSA